MQFCAEFSSNWYVNTANLEQTTVQTEPHHNTQTLISYPSSNQGVESANVDLVSSSNPAANNKVCLGVLTNPLDHIVNIST